MSNINPFLAEALSDTLKVPALRAPFLNAMINGVCIIDKQYSLVSTVNANQVLEKVKEIISLFVPKVKFGVTVETVYDNTGNKTIFKLVATEPPVNTQQYTFSAPKAKLICMIAFYYQETPRFKFVVEDNPACSLINQEIEKYILPLVYCPPITIDYVTVDQKGNVSTDPTTIEIADTRVYPEFYPYLEQTPKQIMEGFYESKERLMIFTGMWGAGKSSLLRSMVGYSKGRFLLVDTPDVYENTDKFAALIKYIRKASTELEEGEVITLMLEEADRIVGSKHDSHNTALPLLLSFTDGVLNVKVKVVIATNLPTVDKFDAGLTRGGRHYKTLTFKELTPDEANAARAAIGLEPLEFTKPVALGSALNSKPGDIKKSHERGAIGFTN